MNSKERKQAINKVYRGYHIPGQSNLHTIKQNAVFYNTDSTPRHEITKAVVCYAIKKWGDIKFTEELRQSILLVEIALMKAQKGMAEEGTGFLTEAEKSINGTKYRRDIVQLNPEGTVWEIETDKYRSLRFKEDPEKDKIIIIKLFNES